MTRHFTRCRGCLEIAAIEIERAFPVDLRCGICGSRVEDMGRVEVDRLLQDHERSVCDARCTSARGPKCVCSCQGKNHGGGMAAIVRDAGAVPTLAPRSEARIPVARAAFEEFTALKAQLLAVIQPLRDRQAADGWLPRPEWERLQQLDRFRVAANAARTHGGRMKILQQALGAAK